MLNSEIKYNLSTDYKRLYELLKNGNIIVGFTCSKIDGKKYITHSLLKVFRYNESENFFEIGFILFESDFDFDDFVRICTEHNIRFFDLQTD